MTGAAAIFVKTPGMSPLKTRLAAGLGKAAAEHWYELAAHAVAAVLAEVPEIVAYWAVAEEPAASAAQAWTGLPVVAQGKGPLGTRMGRVHTALLQRHDFVLLLGADTPQLDPAQLADAVEWLSADAPRLAMGPARDGGFWLLGANRAPEASDWVRAPCGEAGTARGFQQAMARHGEWRLLAPLTDVDAVTDLGPMLAELALLDCPSAEQLRLAEWSRGVLANVRTGAARPRTVPRSDA
jgi:uncharacterized protein